jgi:hypothetical protein
MSWDTKRREPYTAAGIARLKCIRCGAPAAHQWSICADGNNHRPICQPCDIALNRLVLEWLGHPRADELVAAYERRGGASQ